jgi:hypothetical protein
MTARQLRIRDAARFAVLTAAMALLITLPHLAVAGIALAVGL